MPPIRYTLTPSDPKGHLFHIELIIQNPDPEGQILRLPNWIPGSYLIRDFAKHLIEIQAKTLSGTPLTISPIATDQWQLEPVAEPVQIQYQVYAWDLSVRGAHFDESHAFFNGTSVFLAVEGQTEAAIEVNIQSANWMPKNWQLATTLMPASDDRVNAQGFGSYQAPNYWDLIDEPVEIGELTVIHFEAKGIPHRMVLSGQHDADTQRLAKDLTTICEFELDLWGTPYPIEQYLFIVLITDNLYGGLEHKNNTVLMCGREDLPFQGMGTPTEKYQQFLELCSHEYFHLWNVKRIQPKVFQETLLQSKAYTEQLWWFEGITSYYDGYILYRCGLLTAEQYLNNLAKQMTRVYRMPGRFKQSVADSSFLSWTKFYQQDENAPNAIISYYTKGSLIALALDLIIRQATNGQQSLDNILRYLWQHYGQTDKGLEERELEAIIMQVTGLSTQLNDFFERYLYGTEDLPLPELLQNEGIEMQFRPPKNHQDLGGGLTEDAEENQAINLGANLVNTEHQTIKITHVFHQGIAYQAGLAAKDEIIALDGLKMANRQQLESWLNRKPLNSEVRCHFFRQGVLKETLLKLTAPPCDRISLQPMPNFSDTPPSGNWLNVRKKLDAISTPRMTGTVGN